MLTNKSREKAVLTYIIKIIYFCHAADGCPTEGTSIHYMTINTFHTK